MCDWCQGGAADLVYNKKKNAGGTIDEKTGEMLISVFPKRGKPPIQASRIVNFCPMCGRPVGSTPLVQLLRELRGIFGANIELKEISRYIGSIGWKMAKNRVPELRYMTNDEIIRKYDFVI